MIFYFLMHCVKTKSQYNSGTIIVQYCPVWVHFSLFTIQAGSLGGEITLLRSGNGGTMESKYWADTGCTSLAPLSENFPEKFDSNWITKGIIFNNSFVFTN